MSTSLWIRELADAFWMAVGGPEGFPRALRRSIARAVGMEVTVVLLPRLHVATVDAWLRGLSIACPVAVPDRPLRACLVARYGAGFIFIDGADPEDEQRFSLGHELAHFLHDYWQPRRQVCRRLGAALLEVLDGERGPSDGERIDALLARMPLGAYTHFMERTANGHAESVVVLAAERQADQLAFELLAPSGIVLQMLEPFAGPARREAGERLLQDTFGLPAGAAVEYAALLAPAARPHPLLERLGLSH